MCHVPLYFDDPRGTGSVLCISSACLESQNKQFRDLLNNRSFKGSIIQQTKDVLRQQYLSGTFSYSKRIEECTEVIPLKCGSCGKYTRHNQRTCSGIPPSEEDTSGDEENNLRKEHDDEGRDSYSSEESDVFSESENDDDDNQEEFLLLSQHYRKKCSISKCA